MSTYLYLDYETRSLLDLEEVGLDRYVKDPSTCICMLGWAIDDEEVELWEPHVGPPPKKLIDAMKNPSIIKVAWNAQFEYMITRHKFIEWTDGWFIPLEEWRDPIVLAHNLSLPGYLGDAGAILKMDIQKDPRGDELIDMFSFPVSKGGEQTLFGIAPPLFRDWLSHPNPWQEWGIYCKQDVRSERAIWLRLLLVPFPEREWKGWLLDQKINLFGMPGNRQLGEKMLRLAQRYVDEKKAEMKALTGLQNPNSRAQLLPWVRERGYPWKSLRSNFVENALRQNPSPLTSECIAVLKLRQASGKTAYKKLIRFLSVLSDDDRLRFQFRYMAAARTGRWAGGDVQVQNMPRGNKIVKKALAHALDLVNAEDYDAIKTEFTDGKKISVVDFITTLLRSLFQAKAGHKLVVADLNAIENRVLGWAAGCWSILEVFTHTKEEGGDPYLAFGTRMYKKTYAEMWASYAAGNEDERQNSKPAVLGAGYGLGGGELTIDEYGNEVRGGLWGYALNVCFVDMPKELAHEAVRVFREAYPEVVQMWTDVEEAFKQVLLQGGHITVGDVSWDKDIQEWVKHPTCLGCKITFRRIKMQDGGYTIRMELPSGRALHYLNATIEQETRTSKKSGKPYTVPVLYYEGIEHSSTTDATGARAKKRAIWGPTKTYGGKLVENAVQAISRDILLNGMILADEMGFGIFGLFHDELATEVPDDPLTGLRLSDLVWCMSDVPDWTPGLLLGAEGYEGAYYRKG